MRSNTHSEKRNGRLRPFKAAVAGLAALCAAARAVAGAAGGAAPVS
ncbi:MAG: hypothetical protein ICV73_26800, partial [Acetobacteraceae bacterium]|nr:hypothetical protein [Acetobacteraceae bacterium]